MILKAMLLVTVNDRQTNKRHAVFEVQ